MKVNREWKDNLVCQAKMVWATVLMFVRVILAVEKIPISFEVLVFPKSYMRSSCPGSLVDKIAAEQVIALRCGPHTHHGKVCPKCFSGVTQIS